MLSCFKQNFENYLFNITTSHSFALTSKICRFSWDWFCQHKLIAFVDQCGVKMFKILLFTKFKVSILCWIFLLVYHFHLNLCKDQELSTLLCLHPLSWALCLALHGTMTLSLHEQFMSVHNFHIIGNCVVSSTHGPHPCIFSHKSLILELVKPLHKI